jgi:4-aminobutyrate aminotransferase/(S)-3-amino-2-methylpropionate transaminase
MAVDQRASTRTAELQAERERLIARGIATTPLFVERAHGARLTDVEGTTYIDFVGGIGTLNGGHTPEKVVAAIKEQADLYLHQCYSIAQYEPYLEVARRLIACHPGAGPYKALLVNTGAEAVENAIKIARYHTGRQSVICFENAFHGRTLMGMSLTAKAMPY